MTMKQSYLLAIETVGKLCGIAIHDAVHGHALIEYVIHIPNMHDALLAELILRAMKDLDIESEQISVIAVSEGPGSFTGVRIGMSFAKGWCADGKTILVSVPTFHAMFASARQYVTDTHLTTMSIIMKSHADSYFMQSFDVLTGQHISSIEIVHYEQAIQSLDATHIVIGDISIQDSTIKRIPIQTSHPTYIAKYGYQMYVQSQFTSPHEADSEYHSEFIPTIGKQN